MEIDAKTMEEVTRICESIGYSDAEIINDKVFAFRGTDAMKTLVREDRIIELLEEARDKQFWRTEKRQSKWLVILSVFAVCMITFGVATRTLTWFRPLYGLVPNEERSSLSEIMSLTRTIIITCLIILFGLINQLRLQGGPWKPSAITTLVAINLILLSDLLTYLVL
ncbi:hypothetical protein [Leptolyngbya sp. AN10]|uniref:hypothetical protein n=1 Tax=Leptolyngbya sp. AN10 TaxID=3423365 RepID=UPI003D3232D1